MKRFKKLRILKQVLVRTGADKMLTGFAAFFFAAALVLWLIEPGFTTYGQSLWYCYTVFSTIGFGDIIAVTLVGRIISVLITIITILITALITGVIVAFYTDIVSMRYKASKAEVLEQLEHLPDLSPGELKELSQKIKKIDK